GTVAALFGNIYLGWRYGTSPIPFLASLGATGAYSALAGLRGCCGALLVGCSSGDFVVAVLALVVLPGLLFLWENTSETVVMGRPCWAGRLLTRPDPLIGPRVPRASPSLH